MKIGLNTFNKIIELGDIALYPGLGECVIVLNTVQQPTQTPETVGLDLYTLVIPNKGQTIFDKIGSNEGVSGILH